MPKINRDPGMMALRRALLARARDNERRGDSWSGAFMRSIAGFAWSLTPVDPVPEKTFRLVAYKRHGLLGVFVIGWMECASLAVYGCAEECAREVYARWRRETAFVWDLFAQWGWSVGHLWDKRAALYDIQDSFIARNFEESEWQNALGRRAPGSAFAVKR